jgi:hypothetical protein
MIINRSLTKTEEPPWLRVRGPGFGFAGLAPGMWLAPRLLAGTWEVSAVVYVDRTAPKSERAPWWGCTNDLLANYKRDAE